MRHVVDYNVDRSQVYVQQCIQPSDTNKSIALFILFSITHVSVAEFKRVFREGGYSDEDTPVPIPNTEVKLIYADGTARATVWESRSPPSRNTLFLF